MVESIQKPIFIYSNGLAFALDGGRFIVMDKNLKWTDFGSGLDRNGKPNKTMAKIEVKNHRHLGHFIADFTEFTFYDYNSKVNLNDLRNSSFLNKGKMKQKPTDFEDRYLNVILHLKRFIKKR